LDAAGQFETARRALEFFVRYQRSDGKIPHEISQSAGRIRWFEDYPYAFYHADTTPYWLMAWGDYWKATADTATIRRVWPAIRKAYEWCRTTVDSTTGLMLNSKGGLGAVEVGDLGVGVRSDIYLSAVWVEALERVARMADAVEPGRRKTPGLGAGARALRERALASVRDRFWLPAQGFYAFALLEDGAIRPELTVWPSTAMSFGLFDDERGMAAARVQARATLLTDWGARSLAGESALFDPLHYNNGTVWPFVTGFTALGQYRYRNPVMGFTALEQIARSGFTWGLGRNPEVFAGMQYEPLETAVPQQFFGTSFIPTVLARGLVGWEPDLPAGFIRLAPQLPAGWDTLTVHHAPAGRAAYDLAIGKGPGRLTMYLTASPADSGSGPAPVIRFEPHLPPGSVVTGVTADGVPASCGPVTLTPRDVQPMCTIPLRAPLRIEVQYQPGYEVLLPETRPARGDRSRGLRLLDQRVRGDSLFLALEGPAGSTGGIRVRHGTERTVQVTFPPGGDRIDDYSEAEVVIGP
ncbi:MAG TPA: amylo-alpha-1,6-glucosidase, partial [Gemmatimonadales bacterium]|nr:amylo-alpha-1,6-glucosidase [Gemmatimonadales bacterium]